MRTTKTLYALLIGINNYPTNPLNGCINDVLALHHFFEKLCRSQKEKTNWKPIFLLAPLENDVTRLQNQGIEYVHPTRQNIINAFTHFNDANPIAGDCCLLYYSGHGSSIFDDSVPVYEDYEISGELQTLVCLHDNNNIATKHHLLDKELGYLIAKTLKGKIMTGKEEQPGIHFLSIMDCCHSGNNTRDNGKEIKLRMDSGADILLPDIPLGFTKTGNCFYKPFEDGQKKVKKRGLTPARHVNISAAQSSESAHETSFIHTNKEGKIVKTPHGIFTFSVLKTLEQSGTNISYSELIQRARMDVRSHLTKQVPKLDAIQVKDANLYFLQNQFSSPKQEYQIAFREIDHPEWILDAGFIQGIVPSNSSRKTTVKLVADVERIIEVIEVRPGESVLDPAPFTEEDKENKLLHATIHEMVFPATGISFGEKLPVHMRDKITSLFESKPQPYLRLVEPMDPHTLEINAIKDQGEHESYMLTNPGSTFPLFQQRSNPEIFLRDTNKVARFETIIRMNNPNTSISRDAFRIEVGLLEGKPFTSKSLNDIPDTAFLSYPADPEKIEARFIKVNQSHVQPAIKVRVVCTRPLEKKYWIGALYCDAQYGITDLYLPVQSIGKEIAYVEMKFTNDGTHNWKAIPLDMDKRWHDLGITEIQDYILFFISDTQQPFSLEKYNQSHISFDSYRKPGFAFEEGLERDDWRTLLLPVRVIVG